MNYEESKLCYIVPLMEIIVLGKDDGIVMFSGEPTGNEPDPGY